MELNRTLLKEPWAVDALEAMDRSFRSFVETYPGDPPATPARWYHFYFCGDCGIFLNWDINSPKEHRCSACGKVYTGEPYDGCWAKLLNGAIVLHMEYAVVLALTREDNGRYLDYIRRNMLYFAEHYSEYERKDKQAGIGKVFPQGLTEAVFVIAMERCIRLLRGFPLFSAGELDILKEKFFREAAALLAPQIKQIHNIHAWMQAAVAACASVLGDKDMLERSVYGEFGWLDQLERGCRKDGLWYEISPGYHFYTLHALLSHAWVAKDNGIELFGHPTLRGMGTAPLFFAYPDNTLPAYNDTHCGGRLPIESYEQLTAAFDDPFLHRSMEWMYKEIPAEKFDGLSNLPNRCPVSGGFSGRGGLFSLFRKNAAAAAAGSPSRSASFLLGDSGIAALQNDAIRVGVKATKYGGGHDHNDKISIDVYDKRRGKPVSYDVGTSGYGIKFTTDWQRSSISHNLVVVNGNKQERGDGQIVFFTPEYVKAVADAAYPGTRLAREINLTDRGYLDRYYVKCEESSVLDYAFHCEGRVSIPGVDTEPVGEPLYPQNGYPLLRDMRSADIDGDFDVCFDDGGICRILRVRGCPGTRVFAGRCYKEYTLDTFGIVVLRREAAETVFSCEFLLD